MGGGSSSLYEHYTNGGINGGLTVNGSNFYLNGKLMTPLSAAIDYFRIPPDEWRTALRQARAAKLNTIETYIPWNLHEPTQENYDFGNGGSDMQEFLDVVKFLKMAQEEDLFALVRAGPYINAEFEYGGFPSWIQRYSGIDVRSSNKVYMNLVKRYFNVLLPLLAMLQFTNGGPIIGFQIENEYGGYIRSLVPDLDYLCQLRDLYFSNNINHSLLFTVDPPLVTFGRGNIPGLLSTASLGKYPEIAFAIMKFYSNESAVMATEFWSGWYDKVGEPHHLQSLGYYENMLTRIINYPAAVNQYIFRGSTNFGFLAGAHVDLLFDDNSGHQPMTSSYDYDAPIRENGDYTEKYDVTSRLMSGTFMKNYRTPAKPTIEPRVAYSELANPTQLTMMELIAAAPDVIPIQNVTAMELLPINNNSGQSYGYIVYRKRNLDIKENSILTIKGRVCDTVMVLINGVAVSPPLLTWDDVNNKFGSWNIKDSTLNLGAQNYTNATLDLIVENWGRSSFGFKPQQFQFKGLYQGPVLINNQQLYDFEAIPLEFKKKYNRNLGGWHAVSTKDPAMYRFVLNIPSQPKSTYLDMSNWIKGFVVVNNFVLGKYQVYGPTSTLFVSKYFLKQGVNVFFIFEHFGGDSSSLKFVEEAIYTSSVVDQNSMW